MGAIASQITSLTAVYSIVYWDADQRKHQSSASLAFVRGIHRGPVNSPHKWPVTRKMFQLMTSSWYNVMPCLTYTQIQLGNLHHDSKSLLVVPHHWHHVLAEYVRWSRWWRHVFPINTKMDIEAWIIKKKCMFISIDFITFRICWWLCRLPIKSQF